jgi:hypothetical protein
MRKTVITLAILLSACQGAPSFAVTTGGGKTINSKCDCKPSPTPSPAPSLSAPVSPNHVQSPDNTGRGQYCRAHILPTKVVWFCDRT